jgi:hypothetical protein
MQVHVLIKLRQVFMLEKDRAVDLSFFFNVFHSNYHPYAWALQNKEAPLTLPFSYTTYFENEFQFDSEHNHSIDLFLKNCT